METKYIWFALGVISSGNWRPVPLHCDRAFSLCEEYLQLLSVNYIALLQCVVFVPNALRRDNPSQYDYAVRQIVRSLCVGEWSVPLDNERCIISVAIDYRVLTETIANIYYVLYV